MKNKVRRALAALDSVQVVHVEKVEFHYVPGQDSRADAAIEQALVATALPESHWAKRFRGPTGLRRPSVG